LASVAPYSAAAFIASKPTTFAELMDPLERLSEQLGRPWGVVSHLKAGAYTRPLFGST
jgi:Zn-dependent oligopeptidase